MNEQANRSYDKPSKTPEILRARPEQPTLQLIWDMTLGLMPSNYSEKESLNRLSSFPLANQKKITDITGRIPELEPFGQFQEPLKKIKEPLKKIKEPLEMIKEIVEKLIQEKQRSENKLDSQSLQILEYFVAQKVLKLLDDLYLMKVTSLMIANRGVDTAIISEDDPKTKVDLQSTLTKGLNYFANETPEVFLTSTIDYENNNTPPQLRPIVAVLRDIAKTKSELSPISTNLKAILATLVDTTTSADASKASSDGDSVVTNSFEKSSQKILDERAEKAAQDCIDSIIKHITLGEAITPERGSILNAGNYIKASISKPTHAKNSAPEYGYYVVFSKPKDATRPDLNNIFDNPFNDVPYENQNPQVNPDNQAPLSNLAIFKRILIDTGFCDASGVDDLISQFNKELRSRRMEKSTLPVAPRNHSDYTNSQTMTKSTLNNGNCVFTREITLKADQTDKPTNTERITVEFSKNGNGTHSLVKLEIGSSSIYNK